MRFVGFVKSSASFRRSEQTLHKNRRTADTRDARVICCRDGDGDRDQKAPLHLTCRFSVSLLFVPESGWLHCCKLGTLLSGHPPFRPLSRLYNLPLNMRFLHQFFKMTRNIEDIIQAALEAHASDEFISLRAVARAFAVS
jgi:hypothetical protein